MGLLNLYNAMTMRPHISYRFMAEIWPALQKYEDAKKDYEIYSFAIKKITQPVFELDTENKKHFGHTSYVVPILKFGETTMDITFEETDDMQVFRFLSGLLGSPLYNGVHSGVCNIRIRQYAENMHDAVDCRTYACRLKNHGMPSFNNNGFGSPVEITASFYVEYVTEEPLDIDTVKRLDTSVVASDGSTLPEEVEPQPVTEQPGAGVSLPNAAGCNPDPKKERELYAEYQAIHNELTEDVLTFINMFAIRNRDIENLINNNLDNQKDGARRWYDSKHGFGAYQSLGEEDKANVLREFNHKENKVRLAYMLGINPEDGISDAEIAILATLLEKNSNAPGDVGGVTSDTLHNKYNSIRTKKKEEEEKFKKWNNFNNCWVEDDSGVQAASADVLTSLNNGGLTREQINAADGWKTVSNNNTNTRLRYKDIMLNGKLVRIVDVLSDESGQAPHQQQTKLTSTSRTSVATMHRTAVIPGTDGSRYVSSSDWVGMLTGGTGYKTGAGAFIDENGNVVIILDRLFGSPSTATSGRNPDNNTALATEVAGPVAYAKTEDGKWLMRVTTRYKNVIWQEISEDDISKHEARYGKLSEYTAENSTPEMFNEAEWNKGARDYVDKRGNVVHGKITNVYGAEYTEDLLTGIYNIGVILNLAGANIKKVTGHGDYKPHSGKTEATQGNKKQVFDLFKRTGAAHD